MKKAVHTICIFLSLAFAFVAVTFCWFSRGELLYFRDDFGSAKASYFGGGDGSRDKPYEISSETHFYNFAWLQYLGYFNHAEANNGRYQSYFRLADNIDMSKLNSALPPIGTSKYPFIGNFDGCGYTVKNVTISNKLNGSDGEALTNYLNVRPTVADNFAADKTVLPVWGDTTKDVNIVGLFGITGDYGSTATAGGVVQEAYGIYSESNTAGKIRDTLKNPAASIEDKDANDPEKAYYGAMSVANFYADNLHVRSASDSTLVGLAAGYANAAIGSVGVYRCDITVKAGATGLSDSAPLSNYSLLGDYNDAVITWDEKPSSGGSSGDGAAWGGSIDMRTLNRRLDYITAKVGTLEGFNISTKDSGYGLYGKGPRAEYDWDSTTLTMYQYYAITDGTVLPLNVNKTEMGLASLQETEYVSTINNNPYHYNQAYKEKSSEVIDGKNTGYIVGGGTSKDDSLIRARIQPLVTGSNDNEAGIYKSQGYGEKVPPTSALKQYSSTDFVMLTIDVEGNTYRIGDTVNSTEAQNKNVFTTLNEMVQYNDSKIGFADKGKLYLSARKNFDTAMDGAYMVHGFHFQKGISTDSSSPYYYRKEENIQTATVKIYNGTKKTLDTYYNYPLVKGGVNFTLAEDGVIKTIVGAFYQSADNYNFYQSSPNSLFDLYKVERTIEGTSPSISSMTRIFNICRNSTTNAISYNTDPGDGWKLVFDFDSLTKSDRLENGAAYYFEMPVNAGDYVIGTDASSSANNAYLMYLDIGANGSGDDGGSAPGTAAYTIDTVDFVNNTADYAANGKFTAFKDVTFNLSGAGTSGVPSVSFERAAAADGEDTAATKVAYIYSNITVLVTPSDGSLSSGTEKKENAA